MGRVAVIVVPGVGDDAPGDTLEAVTRALVARPDVSSADLRRSLISPEADDAPYDLRWARVRPADAGPDTPPEMDVFEMTWSDISRFPGGLLRFFGTLAGLLAQVSTIGLEALKPWTLGERDASLSGATAQPKGSARWAHFALTATSGLLVGPILMMGILLAGLATGLWSTLMLNGHTVGQYAALALIVVVTLLVVRAMSRALAGVGWPFGGRFAFALFIITTSGSWLVERRPTGGDGSLAVSIANTAIVGSSLVFRVLWLIAVAFAVASVVLLAVFAASRSARDTRARAAFTALVSLVIAPIGVALTGATIFASIAALALQTLSGDWGGSTANLLCTAGPGAHLPKTCDVAPAPTDWALALFSQISQPLVWALIVGIVPLALLVVATIMVLAPGVGNRIKSRPNIELRLGHGLSSGLRLLTGRLNATVLAVSVVVGSLVTFWVWVVDGLPGFGSLQLGGISALSVSGLVLATRALALGPRSTFGPLRGLLRRLRVVLDLPYDVATYLRNDRAQIGGTANVDPPRELMLRRYRALLAHVAAGGPDQTPYDGVVIASHSQGTVLTVAAMSGDAWREPVAEPLSATRPGLSLPERVSLLMFGSPLGQLYAQRFPQQFAEFGPEGPLSWRPGGAGATDMWLNVYRAADPVGRSLWAPEFEGAHDPTRLRFAACWLGGPEVREACLPGRGGHTGYWGDARVVDYLVYLTRRAAGADPAWPGPLALT